MREGTRSNFALVGRASCGALVAVMPGVPEPMRRGAGADARRNGAALLCGVAYGGEAEKMDADLRFWRDGFALLIRDTLRHAPTLLSSAPLTPRCGPCAHASAASIHCLCVTRGATAVSYRRQQAARERFQNDVRAFVPFSLLLVNTFPLTMPLLEPVLKKGWLPRHWLLPSAFEQERLRTVERARRLAAAADAGAPARRD
jgi:hypothetical protein